MNSRVDKILGLVDIVGSHENLEKYRFSIENILPENTNKKRYWSLYWRLANSFAANPKITNKKSIISVMFTAAKLNLNPDPAMGEIYFVPYSGELTYQIGYKGMIKMSYNTGTVKDVRTNRVFEKDVWEYWEDEKGQHFRHQPSFTLSESERGRELFCYSVFDKGNGFTSIHTMESYHIEKIKKMVLARTPKSPWANELFEPEMRKKTCLRRHWKTEPKSEELAQAIEYEESIERGEALKVEHPEIEEIIDEITERNSNQAEIEENPLSIFDKAIPE